MVKPNNEGPSYLIDDALVKIERESDMNRRTFVKGGVALAAMLAMGGAMETGWTGFESSVFMSLFDSSNLGEDPNSVSWRLEDGSMVITNETASAVGDLFSVPCVFVRS